MCPEGKPPVRPPSGGLQGPFLAFSGIFVRKRYVPGGKAPDRLSLLPRPGSRLVGYRDECGLIPGAVSFVLIRQAGRFRFVARKSGRWLRCQAVPRHKSGPRQRQERHLMPYVAESFPRLSPALPGIFISGRIYPQRPALPPWPSPGCFIPAHSV